MKRKMLQLLTILLVIAMHASIAALAANTYTENKLARLTPQNGASVTFASSNDYEERIVVTYKDPAKISAGEYYSVMMLDAESGYVPSANSSFLYYDQVAAGADGSITCTLYPSSVINSAIVISGKGVNSLIVAIIDAVPPVQTVPMFRMYDPNGGEHFYTGSEDEKNILIQAGWHYEGVGFNFPAVGAPVHRLYDPVNGDHLYTMNEEEKTTLLAQGWQYEGVAFNSAADTEVPQYRVWNPNAYTIPGKRGAWHFTGSIEERDWLVSLGWQDQGIGWYSSAR